MPTLYAAPAGVDDASRSSDPQALREAWHKRVSGFVDSAKKRAPLFYDHLLDRLDISDSNPVAVPWAAFPKWINTVFEGFDGPFDQQRADRFAETTSPVGLYVQQANGTFSLADFQARQQDEYCEWAIKRDGDRIVSIQFTAEPPEYWESLFENDEKLTTTLYQELLKNSSIRTDDLRFDKNYYGADSNGRPYVAGRGGKYNRYNKWNVGAEGLIHLTQAANTLGAEIFLAGDASNAWNTGKESPSVQELICCALFGEPSRHSDPFIGWSVFDLVESTGACVALANPIGLYMTPFDLADLKSPDGEPIGEAALSFPRKSADGKKILRAEINVPAGANYGLQDCTLAGQPLLYGGQIARRITMAIYAVAKKIPNKTRPQTPCRGFCCNHPESPKLLDGFGFGSAQNCSEVSAGAFRELPSPTGAEALFELSGGPAVTLPAADITDTPDLPEGRRTKK